MASNPLMRINFYTSSNSPWASGDEARVYWDDVNNVITVTKNGTTLTDPSYQVTLGLSITYDVNGVATTHYTARFLNPDGSDDYPIDLPVGDPPVFIQDPITNPTAPVVLPQPGPNNDIVLPPVVTPIQPTPTPSPTPVPVTGGGGKVIVGNGIDTVNYPVAAPTNFIP